MRKRKIAKRLCVIGMAAVFAVVGSVVPLHRLALADEAPSQRLQLNKLADYPTIEPGQIYTGTFNISNTGDQMFKYKIETEPYSVADYSYDTKFDQQNDYTLLSNWVTLDHTSGVLEAGQSEDISYTIKAPMDIPAGGQYAAIAIGIDNDDQSGNIIAQNRVAMLIFATINGETNRSGSIIRNDINGVYFNPPIVASSTVENKGNIHDDVVSTLEVFDMFGTKTLFSNVDKPDKHTVLPKTHRDNQVKWDDAPVFGLYKVKQTVEFMGQRSINERLILICPLWLMILFGVVIVGLIIFVVLRICERRSKTKKNKQQGA